MIIHLIYHVQCPTPAHLIYQFETGGGEGAVCIGGAASRDIYRLPGAAEKSTLLNNSPNSVAACRAQQKNRVY